MKQLNIKRIYEAAEDTDGYRILVDRLWPRGISKDRAHIDEWAKDMTPSAQIRTEIHSKEIDWDRFAAEYRYELENNPSFMGWKEKIHATLKSEPVTFLTAAKLEPQNHASILKQIVLG